MSFDLTALRDRVAAVGRVARIVIVGVKGSAPRGIGTEMLVWKGGQSGTIGGGALEYAAVARAFEPRVETIALGPSLGQCCGGSVTLVTEVFTADTLPDALPYARPVGAVHGHDPEPRGPLIYRNGWLVEDHEHRGSALWIYGAGHVGRALVRTLAPLPDVSITWVDTNVGRFPEDIPNDVDMLVAADPTRAVAQAPDNAQHIIMTYSHQIDFDLCHTILSRSFESAGLIGSATKWARFRKRLATLGHREAQISRIACPIGDPSLGKHPQQIAIGVAMSILGGQAAEAMRGAG